jgi:hypothetical protein
MPPHSLVFLHLNSGQPDDEPDDDEAPDDVPDDEPDATHGSPSESAALAPQFCVLPPTQALCPHAMVFDSPFTETLHEQLPAPEAPEEDPVSSLDEHERIDRPTSTPSFANVFIRARYRETQLRDSRERPSAMTWTPF